MKNDKEIKTRISLLWIVIMINMIFNDIFSIIVELVDRDTLNIPGEVTTIMAIAAVITNIPIFMIFLSRFLKYKLNRILNIAAGIFTIIYIVAGGSLVPHYIVIGLIEIILLIYIIVIAVKWKDPEVDMEQ